MMTNTDQGSLAPATKAALDVRLAAWSARHALSDARADEIRQNVLDRVRAQGDALPYEWWARFFANLRISVQRSLEPDLLLALCQPSTAPVDGAA